MLTPTLTATVKDHLTIANDVSAQLAANAVEQDAKTDIPLEEVGILKQSGLLLLPIPREYGGVGASWPQVLEVTRILSRAQDHHPYFRCDGSPSNCRLLWV